MQELKEKIMTAAIEEFVDKGLKFTMDDLAKNLRISKKTLYGVYATKEEMLLGMVDYCFADIKASEQAVAEEADLDLVSKLKKIMIVMPEKYQNIGLSRLYELKEKFPAVYEQVEHHLNTGWETTLSIMEQGVKEGKLRPFSVPILKAMFERTIESFMQTGILIENEITYEEAMNQMIDILIDGIRAVQNQ